MDILIETPEAELPDLITKLVSEHEAGKKDEGNRVQLTPRISVCALPLAAPTDPTECRIALTQDITPKDSWVQSKSYMKAGLGKSKAASRNLRPGLPDICTFASNYLAGSDQGRIVIACESGKDLSVGVALAIYCYLFDDEGNLRTPGADVSFTKTLIKSRLGFIMTTYPAANPSRSTLQSVNSFLMDWRK
ncbi:hypothetical protein CEP52_000819 [Fusarium oligoseptatum]|uniref:Rit1 DUSP-like domain-containing protein n=1 Tax=Fusarium oligoseptatum TaxID=2604345 RepID=A0A428UM60_9HYPO|nr:hypothetical protein CEP52_000819 [Fusarium oligoseptatum]